MFSKKRITQNFLRISQEHILIYDYIEKFEKIINAKDHSKLFPKLKSMTKTLEKDVDEHFVLEERVFFPTALLCIPSLELIDLVLKLQKEHGLLERDMEEILELMKMQSKEDRVIRKPLVFLLKQFVEILRSHADKEVETLFPLLDADKKSNNVIKDLVNKFNY